MTDGEDVSNPNTLIHRHGTDATDPPKLFLKPNFFEAIKDIVVSIINAQAFRSFTGLSATERVNNFTTFFTQLWNVASMAYFEGKRSFAFGNNTKSKDYILRTIKSLWNNTASSANSAPEVIDLFINLNSVYAKSSATNFDPYNIGLLTVNPLEQYKESPSPPSSDPTQVKLVQVLEGQLDAMKDDKLTTVLQSHIDIMTRKAPYMTNEFYDDTDVTNSMPTDVQDQVNFFNDESKIQTRSNITLFTYEQDITTTDKHGKSSTVKKMVSRRYWTEGLYRVVSLDDMHWNLTQQSQQGKQAKDFVDNMPLLKHLTGPEFRIF